MKIVFKLTSAVIIFSCYYYASLAQQGVHPVIDENLFSSESIKVADELIPCIEGQLG